MVFPVVTTMKTATKTAMKTAMKTAIGVTPVVMHHVLELHVQVSLVRVAVGSAGRVVVLAIVIVLEAPSAS